MDVSVIICTHNPREDHLRRTLESLDMQTLPKSRWELLLVDNASAEPLDGQWDLSWHPHARHVREDELGLTPARLRGISEAGGELFVFVDDDNVLKNDYLAVATAVADAHPHLGCFGAGVINPEFEEPSAPELLPYTKMLALRNAGSPHWSNIPDDPWFPWGAGLVVLRSVAHEHAKRRGSSALSKILGRKGESLTSCEDDEISWTACSLGLGRGIFPELTIIHLIDKRRVGKNYLIRLAEGISYSKVILNDIHGRISDVPAPPPSFSGVLEALLSISPSRILFETQRWWSYRNRRQIEKDFEQASRAGVIHALDDLRRWNQTKL